MQRERYKEKHQVTCRPYPLLYATHKPTIRASIRVMMVGARVLTLEWCGIVPRAYDGPGTESGTGGTRHGECSTGQEY
eukprot:3050579-Rhodomonas_salina.2